METDQHVPQSVTVHLGSDKITFIKGHALVPSDILDALDGETQHPFTVTSHRLLRNGIEIPNEAILDYITFEDGNVFTAEPRGEIVL